MIAVEFENKACGVHGCSRGRVVERGNAHGVRRRCQEVGVPKHFVEGHAVGKGQLQVGAAIETSAEVGVLINR